MKEVPARRLRKRGNPKIGDDSLFLTLTYEQADFIARVVEQTGFSRAFVGRTLIGEALTARADAAENE